jgi:conjugative transfer signal peptidase TraF
MKIKFIYRKSSFFILLLFSATFTVRYIPAVAGTVKNVFPVIVTSNSIRPGLYLPVYGVIHRGDFIQFCLNASENKIARQREYITRGNCNGGPGITKEVIAVPGDVVNVYPNITTIQDGEYFKTYYAPRYVNDWTGKVAPRTITEGCYKLNSGYWVYGNDNRTYSWDSRYYGAVDPGQIVLKIKPLITF